MGFLVLVHRHHSPRHRCRHRKIRGDFQAQRVDRGGSDLGDNRISDGLGLILAGKLAAHFSFHMRLIPRRPRLLQAGDGGLRQLTDLFLWQLADRRVNRFLADGILARRSE
ncbi:hypothetical protein D3C74_320660 [compost metagenome]